MRGITKRFAAVTALHDARLAVHSGEIHALLGENGAGKSTLMHILAGLTTPNSGTIYLDGQPVSLSTPRASRQAGIAMVHQHFTLVPAFTVEENLALDADYRGKRLSYRASNAAQQTLDRATALGWNLPRWSRVAELPVGTQQRVEIVKALATNARLLIFDEPTAVLAGAEVEELFSVLRQLRDEGHSIILIAHKLAEILAVADRVTVLRQGRNIATTEVANTNAPQLAAWMIGSADKETRRQGDKAKEETGNREMEIGAVLPNTQHPIPNTLFSAANLHIRGDRGELAIRDVKIEVGAGEILGIGGVDGNGQTELAEGLVGLRALETGGILWQGQKFVAGQHPRVGYIPQDRRRAGLATSLSVESNLLFDAVRDPAYRQGLFLQRGKLARLAQTLIDAYDIRTPSAHTPASSLSGGNQQKIVVARALHAQPEWIVAVNPTRGLDIGATRFVHAQLRQAQARGAAIVLISTDLDELAALSTRQAILSGGILTPYHGESRDSTQIGLLLGGIVSASESSSAPVSEPML